MRHVSATLTALSLLVLQHAACTDMNSELEDSSTGPDEASAGGGGEALAIDGDGGQGGKEVCAADEVVAEPIAKPMDIIFVVDNSGSMGEETFSLQININESFASIIEASDVDYRVVMLSKHGGFNDQWFNEHPVCVESPLSSLAPGECNTDVSMGPGINPGKFYHYSTVIQSTNSLCKLLDTFDNAGSLSDDDYQLAPNGWQDWLRPEAFKVIVEITDDRVACTRKNGSKVGLPTASMTPEQFAADFEAQLTQLSPQHFGTPQDPNYMFYSIIGVEGANPSLPQVPHHAADPIVTGKCPTAINAAPIYQWLSKNTGALRFPVCGISGYDSVFEYIAAGIVDKAHVPCELAFPEVPGETIDPKTIVVKYTPGYGGSAIDLEQVTSPGLCKPDAFYIEDDVIKMCPGTCNELREDPAAALSVLYGCLPEVK